MKVKTHEQHNYTVVNFTPEFHWTDLVTVSEDRSYYVAAKKAMETRITINWGCTGSVGVAEAKQFRDCLNAAIEEAEKRESEVSTDQPTDCKA